MISTWLCYVYAYVTRSPKVYLLKILDRNSCVSPYIFYNRSKSIGTTRISTIVIFPTMYIGIRVVIIILYYATYTRLLHFDLFDVVVIIIVPYLHWA